MQVPEIGSDPNTNSSALRFEALDFAENEAKGGRPHTWWMLVAGEGRDEDLDEGWRARPVRRRQERKPTREESESERKKGKKRERRGERGQNRQKPTILCRYQVIAGVTFSLKAKLGPRDSKKKVIFATTH